MKEKIVNIFLFINEDNFIEKLGGAMHEIDGDDEVKLTFLEKSLVTDLPKAKTFQLPETVIVVDMETGETRERYLSYETYQNLSASGQVGDIFFELTNYYQLPKNFLCTITPVRNGKISIDRIVSFS